MDTPSLSGMRQAFPSIESRRDFDNWTIDNLPLRCSISYREYFGLDIKQGKVIELLNLTASFERIQLTIQLDSAGFRSSFEGWPGQVVWLLCQLQDIVRSLTRKPLTKITVIFDSGMLAPMLHKVHSLDKCIHDLRQHRRAFRRWPRLWSAKNTQYKLPSAFTCLRCKYQAAATVYNKELEHVQAAARGIRTSSVRDGGVEALRETRTS